MLRAANRAYVEFGRANGLAAVVTEAGIGTNVLEKMQDPARPYYRRLLSRVLDTGEPAHHDYQCSSPEVLREFRMSIYPLDHAGQMVRRGDLRQRSCGLSRRQLREHDEAGE